MSDYRRGTEHDAASVAWRTLKLRAHQARRLARWATEPHEVRSGGELPVEQIRLELPLHRDEGHPVLERGKRRNLQLAAPAFDGLLLHPERPLSFWRTLGRVTRGAGFEDGMELRAGCIVPALGGGLCLLSNALFEIAARLGWTILERHGHTTEAIPDHSAIWGLDATLFWPHVDLRVAPRRGRALLRAQVSDEHLVLEVRGHRPVESDVRLRAANDHVVVEDGVRIRQNVLLRDIDGVTEVIGHNRKRLLHTEEARRNCLTCGIDACHLKSA